MSLNKPLAEILRPEILSDFIGQEHLTGEDGPIRKALANKSIYSMIFWGPPGCGKTTLARIIAKELNAKFYEISPTTAGVKEIREIVAKNSGTSQLELGKSDKTILFVDEIHRFNKAQQDYLLPHVENGTITLIGATTENPSFEVVSPLLSRSQVYVFKSLESSDMEAIIGRALNLLKERQIKFDMTEEARDFLASFANGDARIVLNAVDAAVKLGITKLEDKDLENILQARFNRYDKNGEEHYNTISAFIKSMRAGKPDAALYYLARMVESGEDPKFIARRMVVFASEDVGLANPEAINIANNVFRACESIGYPECQINLAHGTVYLAKSPKSRDSYNAYFKAKKDVQDTGNLETPLFLRNAPTKLMKELGYGQKGLKDSESFLPEKLKNRKYL